MSDKLRVGFAMTGSFCTFAAVLPQIEKMCTQFELTPIMSETAYKTDTRFGKAWEHINQLEAFTGQRALHTLAEVEPIGPKKLLDILVVAPATGNTIAKLAHGIADTAPTLAVKAHLRNERPVVLAVSTNDALCGAAKNIGQLLATKHYFFVPMRQDDPAQKPRSVVADMSRIFDTVLLALKGQQIQPILLSEN